MLSRARTNQIRAQVACVLEPHFQAPGLAEEEGRGGASTLPKIVVGICAMDKKAGSKQMRSIVKRLLAFNEFEIVHFGDATILDRPIEEWPTCDALLSWHSEGFPLQKVRFLSSSKRDQPWTSRDGHEQQWRRSLARMLMCLGMRVPAIFSPRCGVPLQLSYH